MADEPLDAPPAAATPDAAAVSTPAPVPASARAAATSPVLRPRRESFEHGLLPIPKLVFPEGTLMQTLAQLKGKLSASGAGHVGAAALAEVLQIPVEQATSVADVWPSTSAFDGYLSALSPIQISNFLTWSKLTILLLWIIVILRVYYIKLSSREHVKTKLRKTRKDQPDDHQYILLATLQMVDRGAMRQRSQRRGGGQGRVAVELVDAAAMVTSATSSSSDSLERSSG